MDKKMIARCLTCLKPLYEDDHMLLGPYGETYCCDGCLDKSKKCAHCEKPMDGDTSMWRKNTKLFCSEDCKDDHKE